MGTQTGTRIAGSKTDQDWLRLAQDLSAAQRDVWRKVFDDYFFERLRTRYLEPIKTLQAHGRRQGEGFSIVAIQCGLIEFLESTYQGKNYRYRQKDIQLDQYEYSDSKKIFVQFLCKRQPFAAIFSKQSGRDFYVNVRCGLLHEARTKGGWKIRGRSGDDAAVNLKDKIVFRDGFQKALMKFIECYGSELQSSLPLQQAFIRKYNHLCR